MQYAPGALFECTLVQKHLLYYAHEVYAIAAPGAYLLMHLEHCASTFAPGA